MRRLTKAERAAAAAVLTMAAGVAGTGVTLLKRHTRYMAKKAAAMFKDDESPADGGAVQRESAELPDDFCANPPDDL